MPSDSLASSSDKASFIIESTDPVDLSILDKSLITSSNFWETSSFSNPVFCPRFPVVDVLTDVVALSFVNWLLSSLTLRSGETITDAIKTLKDYDIQGFLFNCSYPESITEGLKYLKQQNLPFGGYANAFTSVEPLKPGGTVDNLKARKDLDAQDHARQALGWIDEGATIVGGCCEIGPDEIAELRNQLVEKGYSITALRSGCK